MFRFLDPLGTPKKLYRQNIFFQHGLLCIKLGRKWTNGCCVPLCPFYQFLNSLLFSLISLSLVREKTPLLTLPSSVKLSNVYLFLHRVRSRWELTESHPVRKKNWSRSGFDPKEKIVSGSELRKNENSFFFISILDDKMVFL